MCTFDVSNAAGARPALDLEGMAALVVRSADPIVGVDADGVIRTWNAAAERAFGRPAAMTVGLPLLTACLDDAGGSAHVLRSALRAGRSLAGADVRCRHADGTALRARLTLAPLRDAGGAVNGAAALLQDVRAAGRPTEADGGAPEGAEPNPGTGGAVERLVESARTLLDMDVAWLGEVDAGDLVFRALAGDRALLGAALGERIPLERCYCGFLVQGRIGNVVADVRAHPELGGLRLTLSAGIGAYVGVPVRLPGGHLYGTLCAASRRSATHVEAHDLRAVRVLADLVARHLDDQARAPRHGGDAELATIRSLLASLDARDTYRAGRTTRVAATAAAISASMGLDASARLEVQQVALLRDLGKIGIPEAILHKHGPLTAREWACVREHPAVCERIVASVPPLAHLAPCVRAAHERWDGNGYPDGLLGDTIPLADRITLAADAWHAMRSARPYRRAMSAWAARTELQRGAGRQFDPAVVDVLLRLADTA